MAHRPCLLSVHVPSATAGMTSLYDHLRPILGCTQQAGQSYLNSDATIAHEGRPQGAPLPIVFSRRFALGRAPTRGAPTDCLLAALPLGRAPTRGAPTDCFLAALPLERAPTRGAPTDCFLAALRGRAPTRGAPTDCLLAASTLGRAPTRGAPTDCLLAAFAPGEGTHKGRPYRLSSLGVLPWGGCPQGAPLPIVFSRRLALGRGAPTDCLLAAFCPGEGNKGCPYRLSSRGILPWGGHPQGAPLPIVFSRHFALGRAPTRGAPTDCLLAAPGKGTHKGCPYRLSSRGVWPWEGCPQGVPLPIVFSRRLPLGRAPTRGAPTDCLLAALPLGRAPTRGAPTDCFLAALPLERAPTRGAPTDCFLAASTLGRAPTRGAPTDCFLAASTLGRAPTRGAPTDCLLSALPLGRAPTRGAPTDCLLSAYCPGKGTHRRPKRGRPYPIEAASRGFSNLMQLPRPSRGARWTAGIR